MAMDHMGPGFPPRPDLIPPAPEETWAPIPRRRAPRAIAAVVALAVLASSLFAGVAFVLRDEFRPEGEAWEHRFIAYRRDGSPLRWNPCDPIHYVINAVGAPEGSVEDVHASVARVSAATGIEFVYDGVTEEEVRSRRPAYQPARYPGGWAPVLVAWVDPEDSDISFRDGEHEAAAVARPITPPTGEELIVSGWIAMSEDDPNPPGFAFPGAQGPTLLHEWGHIMGLGHVGADGQLMEPSGGWMRDFGPGDLAGLEELGAGGGCLDAPAPRAS